jgi:hypothetical protein
MSKKVVKGKREFMTGIWMMVSVGNEIIKRVGKGKLFSP